MKSDMIIMVFTGSFIQAKMSRFKWNPPGSHFGLKEPKPEMGLVHQPPAHDTGAARRRVSPGTKAASGESGPSAGCA